MDSDCITERVYGPGEIPDPKEDPEAYYRWREQQPAPASNRSFHWAIFIWLLVAIALYLLGVSF